jgi:hypothetical protein
MRLPATQCRNLRNMPAQNFYSHFIKGQSAAGDYVTAKQTNNLKFKGVQEALKAPVHSLVRDARLVRKSPAHQSPLPSASETFFCSVGLLSSTASPASVALAFAFR